MECVASKVQKLENFQNGKEFKAYEFFGCHKIGNRRYVFRVWAPHAKAVYVKGAFCGSKERLYEMQKLCDILGILTERKVQSLDQEIEEMIAARQKARKEKNFALADEIRAKLSEMGIILEDTREGVKWKRG